jgi:CheY-like chemotaxis protein
VRKLLEHAGYTVLEAYDGETGLNMAIDNRPDLILMDVNLPDIDGLKVTARIKKTPSTNHIPVIALTANAMHGDKEKCLAAGCDNYMPKPISKTLLLETVMATLQPQTIEQ